MNARAHRACRVALLDSDALQRICTNNSLQALGLDCVAFGRVSELVAAMKAKLEFDAVIVGLHADAPALVSRLPEVHRAAGMELPVLFLAHHTELGIVCRLPTQVMAREGVCLLPSPVEEGALLGWLRTLSIG